MQLQLDDVYPLEARLGQRFDAFVAGHTADGTFGWRLAPEITL